ncbi:MAG: tyrosine-type recombinase/integrase [Acidovorax defluvii]
MRNRDLLGPWVRRFLLEHIVAERNLARNTQLSYRDTLALLLPFAAKQASCGVDKLAVNGIAPPVVRVFLVHLEQDRHCSIVTRNQRLAAIHAMARFIGSKAPEHLGWCTEIMAIPFKKSGKRLIGYLDKAEMDALLAVPDLQTRLGFRDHAMLLFMYNSGARADEVANLRVNQLQLGTTASVRIVGKGNKTRICPLWERTAQALRPLIEGGLPDTPVFRGRTGEAMTRFGVHRVVTDCGNQAKASLPSLQVKRVSPHNIRHTTAVHLLRAGVDINTIRAWLGHVSLDTTNMYAEVDLEMKAKALAAVELPSMDLPDGQNQLPSLMAFMKGL